MTTEERNHYKITRAFPSPSGAEFDGMSLRDYFATHALQGLLSRRDVDILKTPLLALAEDAYSLADAMMKARDR